MILTGSYRGEKQLEVWSLSQRTLMAAIDWDEKKQSDCVFVYSAMFDKKIGETIIAGGTGRNEMKMFDYGPKTTSVGSLILPKSCMSLDITYQGNMVALGCGDGKLRLLEVSDGSRTPSNMSSIG
jgi:COMPASS component SWD3